MKKLIGLLSFAILAGCGDSGTETVTTNPDTPAATSEDGEASQTPAAAVSQEPVMVAYKAGDNATLAVPEMSCQINCYPKVKKALEGITGVKSVELVPQEDEVVVNDRRVKIEFDGDVDGAAALTALDGAGYPGSSFE
ncbi:MAG: heavy metal-associated domain-containing protein [Planctomycetaceae bacterium]